MHKIFGVHMDGELKLHKHITEKCKIASCNLYSIWCIRDTLMVEACKQVVQLLVISHLDYCNSIFMGMPEKEINQMQKIQNSAACLILIGVGGLAPVLPLRIYIGFQQEQESNSRFSFKFSSVLSHKHHSI